MGILKNKIISALAIGGVIATFFFTMCGAAGKMHVFSQNFNKTHDEASSYATTEEYNAAQEAYQKEADRVNPIANGMLITAGACAVVGTGAIVANEIEKKKQAKKEKDVNENGIEDGFAGTL